MTKYQVTIELTPKRQAAVNKFNQGLSSIEIRQLRSQGRIKGTFRNQAQHSVSSRIAGVGKGQPRPGAAYKTWGVSSMPHFVPFALPPTFFGSRNRRDHHAIR